MSKNEFGLLALVGTILLMCSGTVLAQADGAAKYKEGTHYTVIENAPVTTGNTVAVVEAFSYMCTHCATFEPYISNWQQRKPDNVSFRRIPVVFGRGSWEIYARAYSTAEVMGIADEAHGALMDKIWKEKVVARNMEELGEFYSAYGADPAVFVATSKSFAVDAKLRKDQRTLQTAAVRGTPSIIVNDKYLVAGSDAVANYDVFLDVVDFVIALELDAQDAAAVTQAAGAEENVPADADS